MAIKKKKAVRIRPTKTGRRKFVATDRLTPLAYEGAKKGLNEEEISQAMGCSYRTFQRHKDEFRPEIKKGRDESTDGLLERVESSLLKRCEGYFVEETATERRGSFDGTKFTGTSQAVQKKTKKYVNPSDMAIIFYLVNRSNEKWKSINKPDFDRDNDKGSIMDAIKDMKKNPV